MSAPTGRASLWGDAFGRTAVRSAQLLLVIAVVVVIGYVGVRLRLVVVPLLVATLLAAALWPVVTRLRARRLPRPLAVWTTLLALVAVLGAAFWFIGRSVSAQWGELVDGATEGLEQLQTYASDTLGVSAEQVEQLRASAGDVLGGSAVQSGAITGAAAVAQVVTGLFLGLVVLYFLLADGDRIYAFLRDQTPRRHHRRYDAVADRAVGVLGGYVRGTALIALVDATVIGVALAVLGVPLALPLAVVVFFGAFVPIVGATAAGVLAALIALVGSGPVTALIVLGVVIAVNQLEGDLLAPVVLGRSLRLHPLAVLLALAAGTIVAGVVGAVLAVPFAAVAWAAVTTVRAERAAEPPEPGGEADRAALAPTSVEALDGAAHPLGAPGAPGAPRVAPAPEAP